MSAAAALKAKRLRYLERGTVSVYVNGLRYTHPVEISFEEVNLPDFLRVAEAQIKAMIVHGYGVITE